MSTDPHRRATSQLILTAGRSRRRSSRSSRPTRGPPASRSSWPIPSCWTMRQIGCCQSWPRSSTTTRRASGSRSIASPCSAAGKSESVQPSPSSGMTCRRRCVRRSARRWQPMRAGSWTTWSPVGEHSPGTKHSRPRRPGSGQTCSMAGAARFGDDTEHEAMRPTSRRPSPPGVRQSSRARPIPSTGRCTSTTSGLACRTATPAAGRRPTSRTPSPPTGRRSRRPGPIPRTVRGASTISGTACATATPAAGRSPISRTPSRPTGRRSRRARPLPPTGRCASTTSGLACRTATPAAGRSPTSRRPSRPTSRRSRRARPIPPIGR